MPEIHELVNLVLNDSSFRQSLIDDPEGTLRANGVEPTDEILASLEGVDHEALKQLAQEFGNQEIAAANC